jgi:branched-chain amino acid transport system permease protein
MNDGIPNGYLASARLRWWELLPWLFAVAAFFVMPDYLALATRILIFILFALSLDLLIGYAGIITLGHSAFFGAGAYICGIRSAKFGLTDPLLQLAASGVGAGLLGLLTGAVILRMRGLTLLMLTLVFAALCMEVANRATNWTGGADGLSGVTVAPLLGMFRFDMFGKTAYIYTLVVLAVAWLAVRTLIYSPFGVSLAGIRQNHARMNEIGAPVYGRLLTTYVVAAAIAGIAGALLTQTNQFVGINTLGFELSGELLIMLILGGAGKLYGAFIGPLLFLVAQDQMAKEFPEDWYLGVGILLVLVVLFAPGGLAGLIEKGAGRLRRAFK